MPRCRTFTRYEAVLCLALVALWQSAAMKYDDKPVTEKEDAAADQLDNDGASGEHRAELIKEYRSYEKLWYWVWENGGTDIVKVRVQYFMKEGRHVRGLAYNSDLKAGDFVFHMNQSIILFEEHPLVKESPCAKSETAVFLCYLATEHVKVRTGRESFWEPWISVLPTLQDYEEYHPMFATNETLEAFQALPVVQVIYKDRWGMRNTWEEHHEGWLELAAEAGAPELNYDDYRWAMMTMLTRQYSADWNKGGTVMVPIADLANAASSKTVDWSKQLDNLEEWSMWVPNDVKEGDEVLQQYTIDKGNAFHLRLYGFIDTNTSWDLARTKAMRHKHLCDGLKETMSRDPATSSQPILFSNLKLLATEQCPHLFDENHQDEL